MQPIDTTVATQNDLKCSNEGKCPYGYLSQKTTVEGHCTNYTCPYATPCEPYAVGGTPLLQMEDGTVILGGFNPPSQEEINEMLARLKSMRIALDPVGEAHKVGGGFFVPPKPKTPDDLKLLMQKLSKEVGRSAQALNEFNKAFGDLLALINKEIQDYAEI